MPDTKKYTMPNKCPVCGKRFKYKFCLQDHLKTSKICSSQVPQTEIDDTPTAELDLTQENGQIVIIQQEQHKCSSCELNFPSNAALLEHNQRCYKMEFKCKICNKRFKYEWGYTKHMSVEHGTANVKSTGSTATSTVTSSSILTGNKNIPTAKKAKKTVNYGNQMYRPYTMSNKCSICGKRFKEEFCLDKHMEVIHSKPKTTPSLSMAAASTATVTATTTPTTVHYATKSNIHTPQPQIIQYQTIQTIDGVQMVQEIQTIQAVEAVEMPKVLLCNYCNAPFTKKHYLTEHVAQNHQ